ncbi:pyridoxamine 5'-phosphate oxidase [Fodinibius halophilus]|uniref:Pyridoxamine 5'-phosphate oxidase n=1 Tax=Fodinibius halophilus TaxID=1736908 RepID=A0A6M1TD79_9BACT|nr:pyridoxamine 5'-phosphate oxidase [Fodinibius halophilus]NGP89981.1 pyridoxamine 5'-phosphate oxidase [Fodinibius halophilus]
MSADNTQKGIEKIRREYAGEELSKSAVDNDPIAQFEEWFEQALSADVLDANAMTLSTVSGDGQPSSRIVLLKGIVNNGFRFYTNYGSRKGQEMEENPLASLCFYWAQLSRQVRIEGKVERLSRETSESYFQQRPRLSKIGAWASKQSNEVSSREELESKFEELKKRFDGQDVPLPDFWGGYLLVPHRIEFWQGRPGRLHDRVCYKKEAEEWQISRLAP